MSYLYRAALQHRLHVDNKTKKGNAYSNHGYQVPVEEAVINCVYKSLALDIFALESRCLWTPLNLSSWLYSICLCILL